MNGGGGSAYNKGAAKRNVSSLVFSKSPAGGSGAVVTGLNRRNSQGFGGSTSGLSGGGGGNGRASARGGQLQLQSVSRAQPPAVAIEQGGGARQQQNRQHLAPSAAGGPSQPQSTTNPPGPSTSSKSSNNDARFRAPRASQNQGSRQHESGQMRHQGQQTFGQSQGRAGDSAAQRNGMGRGETAWKSGRNTLRNEGRASSVPMHPRVSPDDPPPLHQRSTASRQESAMSIRRVQGQGNGQSRGSGTPGLNPRVGEKAQAGNRGGGGSGSGGGRGAGHGHGSGPFELRQRGLQLSQPQQKGSSSTGACTQNEDHLRTLQQQQQQQREQRNFTKLPHDSVDPGNVAATSTSPTAASAIVPSRLADTASGSGAGPASLPNPPVPLPTPTTTIRQPPSATTSHASTDRGLRDGVTGGSVDGSGAAGASASARPGPGSTADVDGEGEAAIRARLVEAEARNASMLARVRELEENNFDLEASMQMIEVEATHRVEKQAKALQSELKFKDHQLALAQKSHSSALRDLNAERDRRKKDRERQQQLEKRNNEAAAKAAASVAAESKAAAEAATVTVGKGSSALDKGRGSAVGVGGCRQQGADRRKREFRGDWWRTSSGERSPGDENAENPLLLSTSLRESILTDLSADIMVLLNAGGQRYGWEGDGGGGGGGGTNSSGSDGELVEGLGFRDQTPSRGGPHQRFVGDDGAAHTGDGHTPSSNFGQGPSSTPAGSRRGHPGGSGGFSSARSRRQGFRRSDAPGASPSALAFSPVRLARWDGKSAAVGGSAGRGAADDTSPAALRGGSAARSGSRSAHVTAGIHVEDRFSTGTTAANRSPRLLGGRAEDKLWVGADTPGGGALWRSSGVAGGGGVARFGALQALSSRMFMCTMALVKGEACAGDLLDVLLGFLETLSGDTDGDLKILVSAVRLVHRTLAATPPAAAAVGLSGSPRQSRRKALSYTKTAASVSVDRRLGLDDGPEVREAPPSKGKGKGKKRGRSELGGDVGVDRMSQDEDSGEDSRRSSRKSGSRVHRSTGNPAADAASASTGGTAFPSGTSTVAETTTKTALESSIFVAGKPITAADIPVIQGNAWCSKTTQDRIPDRGVAGGGDQTVREGTGRRDRVGTANEGWPWAGTKGVEDLARRVKDRLVVWFHRGAIAGGSALVEACLQAILTAVWDQKGDDLLQWGCLLDAGSLDEVLFSDMYRSAWALGAQILRVLVRNATLFRRLAATNHGREWRGIPSESEEETDTRDDGSGGDSGDGTNAGVSAAKSATTEATSLPTPPSRIPDVGDISASRNGRGREYGGGGTAGGGNSLLRRLCLDAMSVGENAPFGMDVALRLSVVRLAFYSCHRYGEDATRALFGNDGVQEEDGVRGDDGARDGGGSRGGEGRGRATGGRDFRDEGEGETGRGEGITPTVVHFIRVELDEWERRRYATVNPIVANSRERLLKEAFQLLWVLAMHTPFPLRDMAQGAGMFNTMVSVVSRFYNSVEMEGFQVHKEAMMLMEKMN